MSDTTIFHMTPTIIVQDHLRQSGQAAIIESQHHQPAYSQYCAQEIESKAVAGQANYGHTTKPK